MERKVILLFGGESEERLVSVASAQFMAQAFPVAKLWFWHKSGSIYEINYQQLINHNDPYINELNPPSNALFNSINEAICSPAADDHVFLLGLHGGNGENGYVQNLFEKANRPFTGSNAAASRRSFDKIATKDALKNFSLRMAPHIVIETHERESKEKLLAFFDVHGPLIIKPVCGGSSIGTIFMRTKDDITVAVQHISSSPQTFMAEQIIEGREITVGVINTAEGPMSLPCTEILLESDRNFDYNGKYLGKGSKEITPAVLPENLTRDAQRMAIAAHVALELDGYSRTDMILAQDGYYFLETNTLPGLSKSSLVPQQLAVQGISMREFLASQIEFALIS